VASAVLTAVTRGHRKREAGTQKPAVRSPRV